MLIPTVHFMEPIYTSPHHLHCRVCENSRILAQPEHFCAEAVFYGQDTGSELLSLKCHKCFARDRQVTAL